MSVEESTNQYVLLPARDVRLRLPPSGPARLERATTTARWGVRGLHRRNVPAVGVRVVDSIRDDGPKLIEVSPQAAAALRAYEPDVRLVPVVYYTPATAPRPIPVVAPAAAGARVRLNIALRVVSAADAAPVEAATVIAFTDFARRIGAQADTDGNGEAVLSLAAGTAKVERLYVYPQRGYWSTRRDSITVTTGDEIALAPLVLSFTDALRHFYGHAPDAAGQGVRVAVVDTGIAPHPDLIIEGGENTVTGENPGEYGDNGEGHGTHVAGIIAARGAVPDGLRGLAPGVGLCSYRVFPQGSGHASNFAVAKAIDRAVAAQCDLINLSLGNRSADPVLSAAVEDARNAGSLVIAAAGNDGRAAVSHPAADNLAVAVAALGRKGTFPTDSTHVDAIAAPFGNDADDFVAAFSNIGPEIDLIGPGVGIVSTVPGGYVAMDGTSMACPAVTAVAARLLADRAHVRHMPRGRARADALAALLFAAARPIGFGPGFEGRGRV